MALDSCEYLKFKKGMGANSQEGAEKPIARVYGNYLYPKDLVGVTSETTKVDSQNIVLRYVKSWIKKQLLINEATSKLQLDKTELERKILDYRYALIVYEFEKLYVNSELNKDVSEEEIQEYYQNNLDNFQLKQNIIKGIFIKIPKEVPKIDRLREWLKKEKKYEENIRSYCYRFSTVYSLEDSAWLNFDEVTKNTPLGGIPNKIQFLKENKYIEDEDDDHLYFLKIHNYKISNQISPLEFVRENITNIIINKRKIDITTQLEEKLYKRASESKDFEIYDQNN